MRRLLRLVRLGLACSPPMRPRAPRPAPLTGCVLPRAVPRPSQLARAVAVARAQRLTASRRKRFMYHVPGLKGLFASRRVFCVCLLVSLASRCFSALLIPNTEGFPSPLSPATFPHLMVIDYKADVLVVPAPGSPEWSPFLSSRLRALLSDSKSVASSQLQHRLLRSLRSAPEWTFSLWRISLGPDWEALLFCLYTCEFYLRTVRLSDCLDFSLISPPPSRVSPKEAKGIIGLISDSSPFL